MLDDKRLLAIQLLIDNKLNKTEIAQKCERSRQWLYDILEEEEVKKELDSALQRIKLFGEQTLKSNLSDSIANVVYLANNANSEKIKLEANTYLIDRVLGKPTSKVDMQSENKEDTNQVDVLENIEKFIGEEEESSLRIVR